MALALSINGKPVTTVGIESTGLVSALLMWTGKPGEPDDFLLHLGALDSAAKEHVCWPELPEIGLGDTIEIQVIETDAVNPFLKRYKTKRSRSDGPREEQ